jgi:hypothetical protein
VNDITLIKGRVGGQFFVQRAILYNSVGTELAG